VRGALRTLLVNPAGCSPAEDLAAAATERFAEHPDAAIITSMPGLAELTGARVLAEIGDDRTGSSTPEASRPTQAARR
jgi:transposase